MIEKLKQRPHTKRSREASLLPRMKKFKKRRRQKSQTHSTLQPTDSPRNNTVTILIPISQLTLTQNVMPLTLSQNAHVSDVKSSASRR